MTKGMHCCKFGNTCLADCFFNDILNGRIADMMATHFPGTRINGEIIGLENILPRPLLARVGIFPAKRVGKMDIAVSAGKIIFMQLFHFG